MNGDTPLPYREVSTLDYKKKTVPQTSKTNADLMVMRP
jgi:hypothetical protein